MSQKLNGDAVVKVTQDQVSCQLSGEAVILHLADGVYYGLNPVGARIWQLIQQPRRVSELVEIILSEYDVEEARCKQDVAALLETLASKRLIEIRDAASP